MNRRSFFSSSFSAIPFTFATIPFIGTWFPQQSVACTPFVERPGMYPPFPNTPTEPGVYEVGFKDSDSIDYAIVYLDVTGRLIVRVNAADKVPVEGFHRYPNTPKELVDKFYWGKKITGDEMYSKLAEQFTKERADAVRHSDWMKKS